MVKKEVLVNSSSVCFDFNRISFSFRWRKRSFTFYLHTILMKPNSNPFLTILTIVFGFLLLNEFVKSKIILYTIISVSGLSILIPKFSVFVEIIWFKLSILLSKLIPTIILSIIFFFLLTPLSLLSKLFNSKTDFISKNDSETTFKTCNKNFTDKSFERSW